MGLVLWILSVPNLGWTEQPHNRDEQGERPSRSGENDYAERELLPPPDIDLDDIASWERDRGREWHLGLEAVTDFPVNVGAQISLELPYGFRINSSFGVLPSAYLDAVTSVFVSAGTFDNTTASLINDALGNSFVWRAHLGWRPFRDAGFYLEVGYGRISLQGGLGAADVISTVTDQSLPRGTPEDLQLGIDSTLHMFDAELGWELVIAEHLVLRFALGAALTVGSETTLTPPASAQNLPQIDEYIAEAEGTLDGLYQRYVFTPTFSVGLGYRFF